MYKSTGTIRVFPDGSMKVVCDRSIVEYYKHVIEKRFFGLKTQIGLHGAHISIVLPKKHKIPKNKMKKWNGVKVSFEYDPYIIIGGKGKGFRNFWIKVECPKIDKIKEELGIIERKGFIGNHITVCNTKNL